MKASFPGSDNIVVHRADNGITVLVYENYAAQSVVIDGLVQAGSLSDTKENAGLANFTSEMLMRGTSNRSFDDIFESLESNGASLGFGAHRHATSFYGRALAEDLEMLLELSADSLRNPSFPEDHFIKVGHEIITVLQIAANNTRSMASRSFREELYGDHPYALPLSGYLKTVQAIDRKDLVDFHSSHYGPAGMIISVVGAVDSDTAIALCEKYFGSWEAQSSRTPQLVADAVRPDGLVRSERIMPEKTQSDIVLGLAGPRRSDPEYLAASLANTILGVFGMYGRLGKSIREEQGLAYYSFSEVGAGLGPGPWLVSTGVSPEKVEQATASILVEIKRMRDDLVPEDELEDAKAYRIGSIPLGIETNSGLAGLLTHMLYYDLGLDYLRELPAEITALTADDVRQAARHYLSVNDLVIAVAGPQTDGVD